MCRERHGGICGVFGGEVGCEIVKAAIVGTTDEGYTLEQGLGCRGSAWAIGDVGETVLAL